MSKVKKKERKKNIEQGIAHIQASFNNTMSASQMSEATSFHGQARDFMVSKDHVIVLLLRLK